MYIIHTQAGLYFISICAQKRVCLFGEIKNGVLILNDAGRMVESEWLKLPEHFKNIALHEYIVMPNHFHAILEIVGATLVVAPNATVAQNDENGQPQRVTPTGKKIWQRNYHEHIIRNEQSYMKISDYIINKPANWDKDSLKQPP